MSRAFSALVAVTLSTVASADLIEIAGDRPTLVQNFGVGSRGTIYPAANAIYSNMGADQFTGSATSQGVTVSGNTNCYADDVTFSDALHPLQPGASITEMTWSVYNGNASTTNARIKIRFWLPNGANGGPGTYVTGVAFPVTAILPGVSIFSATIAPGTFLVPSGLKWWAGVQFDNTGASGTTNAQLANLGQGMFGSAGTGLPEVGYSDPQLFFQGAGGNVGSVNNPTGTLTSFGYPTGPTANFGWQFIPEPTTIGLVAAGLFGVTLPRVRRRRRA